MRLIQLIFSLGAASLVAAATACGANNGQNNLLPAGAGGDAGARARTSIRAVLIIASDSGTTDASLAEHEATLRRTLRFKSFRRVGSGASQALAAKDETTIAIGGGYELDLWINWITEREVDFGVRWFKGPLTLVNTTQTRPRRSTSVLGGPEVPGGSGHYAVIVTTE